MQYNDPEYFAQFYNERAESYAQEFAKNQANVPYLKRCSEVIDLIVENGMRVLDVGCGPGHLTSKLDQTVEVVGIDISPDMVVQAQIARPYGQYFVHDFHNSLPENIGEFDVIIASGCFDFCNDINQALAVLCVRLKTPGLFYFTTLELRAGVSNNEVCQVIMRPERKDPLWLNFFSFQEVSSALAVSGLFPVSYHYDEGWISRTLTELAGAEVKFNYGHWIVTKDAAKRTMADSVEKNCQIEPDKS